MTETDQAQSSEQAFNSLFNTPSSSIHSAAAVSLNPSTTPLRKPPGQGIAIKSLWPLLIIHYYPTETRGAELALASPLRNGVRSGPQVLMEPLSGNNQASSPKFSTAQSSPATTGSPSSLVGESSSCSGPFVSCDRLDSSPDVVNR